MTQIEKKAIVSYSSEQMFDLVNDVEAYPNFIPKCESSQIERLGEKDMIASLFFVLGPLHKKITTHNVLDQPNSIQLKLVSGPFKNLEGSWHFYPHEKGCEVSLSMRFTYSNPLMEKTVGFIFEQIFDQMVPCFVARAGEIYGNH